MASRSRMLVQLATGVKNNLSVILSDANSEIDILTQDENENAKISTDTLQTSIEGISYFYEYIYLFFSYVQ